VAGGGKGSEPGNSTHNTNPAVQALELSLERRVPEPYHDRPAGADAGQLRGLLVEIDRRHLEEAAEEKNAVMLVRRMHNTHDCLQFTEADPPCQHRHHFKDVAMMQDILRKCGLPETKYLAVKRK
jgi:hypothetical protein